MSIIFLLCAIARNCECKPPEDIILRLARYVDRFLIALRKSTKTHFALESLCCEATPKGLPSPHTHPAGTDPVEIREPSFRPRRHSVAIRCAPGLHLVQVRLQVGVEVRRGGTPVAVGCNSAPWFR